MDNLEYLTPEELTEYIELKEIEAARACKASIIDFTEYTMDEYKTNWHHEKYGAALDKFIAGEIKNLMVFMPPQHGKSELSTRRTPAKMLGDNPELKVGLVAYAHTIASKFNRDVQRIMDSDRYRRMYPGVQLAGKGVKSSNTYLRNADEFEIIDHKGSLVSVGVGGGLTSRKLDVLIMDDLYKDPAAAWSSTIRENVQDWYDAVADTRLHNNSQQLLVFTRWHEDDLAGYLLRTQAEDWTVVLFEAIRTSLPHPYDNRLPGEALWPQMHNLAKLEKKKANNPIVFDSLYQQNPTPKEGLLMPIGDLKRFSMAMIAGTQPDAIVSAVDVADEGTDKLCQPLAYIYGANVYVVDVLFSQDSIETTQALSALKLDQWKVDTARYESNNGGKGYALEVRRLIRGRTTIDWKHTSQNKHTKILMKSGFIKSNVYFLDDESIKGNKEYQEYLYELSHYPKNGKVKHDDAADGTAQLCDMIDPNNTWGF